MIATATEAPPTQLAGLNRWILWRYENGDKIPYQTNGRRASTRNPAHWSTYAEAAASLDPERDAGLGFVFAKGDGLVGIDLDDCRDPATGAIAPWAAELLALVPSYSEVSPSGRGLKVWLRGPAPFTDCTGRKAAHGTGQVEVYHDGRYFAFTGERYGDAAEVADCPRLPELVRRVFGETSTSSIDQGPTKVTEADVDRCRQALAELPDSIAGERGHDACFRAACTILRHGIDGDDGRALLEEFNADKCSPPWSRRELDHKWKSAAREVMRGREFGVVTGSAKGPRYNVITSAELATGDYHVRYLIDRVLVASQPLVLAGPPKAMKTSTAVAAAVALASGEPFLGEFTVAERQRVLVMSGESGLGVLQDTARRVCDATGLRLAELDNLLWTEDLPKFGSADHLDALAELIAGLEVQTLIVDPAYLSMPGADAGNVMSMGELLRGVGDVCRPAGVTPILLHHTKKHRAGGRLGLADIAWSGFAEWARQWWLIDRRESFRHGTHRLWLDVGGSAGHHGSWALDITEGVADELAGRRWAVAVQDAEAAFLEAEERKEAEQAAKEATKLDGQLAACRSQLLLNPEGLTKTALRNAAGIHSRDIDAVIGALVDGGGSGAVRPTHREPQDPQARLPHCAKGGWP